jgi:diguanylate cyclase (GGDEF)-like protein
MTGPGSVPVNRARVAPSRIPWAANATRPSTRPPFIHVQADYADPAPPGTTNGDVRRPRPSRSEHLLERWRPYRPRRLTPRELRVEAFVAIAFVAVAVVMALTLTSDRTMDFPVAAALIVSLALASRVRLYLGAGYAMPTQLVLVPMLYLLPVPDVPACVALGLVLGTALARPHPERLLTAVGDGWHAVGSSLVFVVAGEPDPTLGSWPVLVGALAAQCATDLLVATAREWLGRGIPPSLQTRVLVTVYSVDACLSAVALPVAVASAGGRFAFVLVLPLVALLAALMSERQRRIERAVGQLDELEREHARLDSAIHRIGDALASTLDRGALLELLVQTAVEALAAEHGRIGTIVWSAEPGTRVPEATLAAAEQAALADAAPSAVRMGGEFALAHPLGTDRVLAIARRGQPFTAEEGALLDYLARQTAVAMENLALHELLGEQATRDELTGLANHRRFQQVLAEAIAHANRAGGSLALAMFDIDDFKTVNDTHGHQQGDLVLQQVADALARTCRTTDEPARYGGEELAVVLPATDLNGAYTLAEAVRVAVEALVVPLPQGGTIRVTVSAGVGALEAHASDAAALIESADSALYVAKRAGKNGTVRGGWVRSEAAGQARRFERTPSPRT